MPFSSGYQTKNGSAIAHSMSMRVFGYKWCDNACDILHSLKK